MPSWHNHLHPARGEHIPEQEEVVDLDVRILAHDVGLRAARRQFSRGDTTPPRATEVDAPRTRQKTKKDAQTMRLEFSVPPSRKRLVFAIQTP
jgi:hypothetical protein